MTKLDGNELSERELEILRLVATGASNKEIALKLFISPNTVKVHLRNIFGKIGAASRTEAALYAIHSGLAPGAPEQENQAPLQILPPTATDLSKQRRFPWWITAMVIIIGIAVVSSFGMILRSSLQPTSTSSLNLIENKPTWKILQPLPAARTGMAITAYENSIFLIGGESVEGITGQVDIYNPELDAWVRRADKPLPVTDAMAAVVGGRIFVPGGRVSIDQVSSQLEIYDPIANQWSQGNPLPEPISGYALTVFEGKLFLFGGNNGSDYLDKVYIYDPDFNEWEVKTTLPTPLAFASVGVARGRIYLFGGFDGKRVSDTVYAYNPNLNDVKNLLMWEPISTMPEGRYRMGITNTDSIFYLVGGMDQSGKSLPALGFLPHTLEWIQVDIPAQQTWISPAVTFLGVNMYVFGGQVNGTPGSNAFSFQILYITVLPLVP